MRKFFDLGHDPDPSLVSVSDYDFGGHDEHILEGPYRGGPWLDDVKLFVDATKQWTDFISTPFMWMIVSTAFKETLAPFWAGGEFSPIHLRDPSGLACPGDYWLASMTRSIACMDMERSEYSWRSPGDLEGVTHLVVDESRVPADAHAFRLAEYDGVLLIDDVVATEIEKRGLTGIALVSCDVSSANQSSSS
jgi:hypothetical protein